MRIGGLQKLTLLDFPEHVACTVFTDGCNFRCPFCHNTPLLSALPESELISEESFFAFLRKRKGILDGVAVTGGEPMLQPDIEDFLRKIKNEGYLVKLDTNGSFPEKLRRILEEGLADYVAMDIKNDPEHLAATIGSDRYAGEIGQSIDLLMEDRVPFEFRTTAVRELHTADSFRKIGERIRGVRRYYIQRFTDSGAILSSGLTAPSEEEMHRFLEAVRPFVPEAALRGIE